MKKLVIKNLMKLYLKQPFMEEKAEFSRHSEGKQIRGSNTVILIVLTNLRCSDT